MEQNMDSAPCQWMVTPDRQDGQALWDCGSLYIITRTNFLSWSYSSNCHPYTLDALSCFSSLTWQKEHLWTALDISSWLVLDIVLGIHLISRGRRCHGRAEVHWSPDYQVWEDFPVVSCQSISLFPGLTFSYLHALSKFLKPSKLFTSTVILGLLQ